MTKTARHEDNEEQLESLFMEAMELDSVERIYFLEDLSRKEPETSRRLQELLRRFNQFDGLMDHYDDTDALLHTTRYLEPIKPDLQDEPESFSRTKTGEPRQIGPYTIVHKLGEGGMGSVYLARQEAPKRNVALKLISKNVPEEFLTRFEAEYQALAMMTHNHIARIFDAGFTTDGIAFISMEYIEGPPITWFCEQQDLPVQERLYLFIQVCNGILHAHQKAVVHRDLKPSNILVTEENQRPAAKIIDFGLAKGLHNPLATKPLQTQRGAFMGTPAYMSPEQLSLQTNQAADTRSDIYSLGVILYEMLTGLHPFDLSRFEEVPVDEALRTLRLEEPPKPSERLRKTHHATDNSRVRGLAKHLQGDLDWIVMKAMAKDVNRRYASVADLRADVVNYLNEKPVSARRPGVLYQWGKFVRRNKVLVVSSAFAFLTLMVALTLAVRGSLHARKAHEQAVAAHQSYEALSGLLEELMSAANPRRSGREVRVVDVLVQARNQMNGISKEQPQLAAALQGTLANTYFGLGLYKDAEHHATLAVEGYHALLGPSARETMRARYYLARILRRQQRYEEAIAILEEVVSGQEQLLGPLHQETLQSKMGMAMALRAAGHYQKAEDLFRETHRQQVGVLGERHPDSLESYVGLANAIFYQKRLHAAEANYRTILEIQTEVRGFDHPETMATRHNLGICLLDLGEVEQAEQLLRACVADRYRVLGTEHPLTNSSRISLARCLIRKEQWREAEKLLEQCITHRAQSLPPHHKNYLRAVNMRAGLWAKTDRKALARDSLAEIITILDPRQNAVNSQYLRTLDNLGQYQTETGRAGEAVITLEELLKLRQAANGKDHRYTIKTMANLSKAYLAKGNRETALTIICKALEASRRNDPTSSTTIKLEAEYQTMSDNTHQPQMSNKPPG